MRDNGYVLEDTLDVLRDMKKMSRKKRRKHMLRILDDDDFFQWLFQPEDIPNLDTLVGDIYAEFTEDYIMQAIIDAVDYDGVEAFNRTHATLITSICNIAIEENNDVLEETTQDKKDGTISRKDANKIRERIEESNVIIAKLLKRSRNIVKKKAKYIAREARLPKYIVINALTTIPNTKYIDQFRIGFYLNNLFNALYSDVDINGNFERGVKWRIFFKEVFGKDNVVEVAQYVLLEGVHRIDDFKNNDDVRECWDSLTTFALKELNDSPQQIRNHMIEMYIKRLEKMFGNKAFDLRVDLLNLDEDLFPKLTETIKKYADKLIKIFKK